MSYEAGTKENVLAVTEDLAGKLVYYDRKDDDELPRGRIEELIRTGEITVDEIAAHFHAHLRASLGHIRVSR